MMTAAQRNAKDPGQDEVRLDPAFAAQLDAWRQAAGELLPQHASEFRNLLAAVEPELLRRNYRKAAAMAQVAANHSVLWHPGTFASAQLDDMLWRIGAAAVPTKGKRRPRDAGPLRILHVVTQVAVIGGHGRMLWRWIGEDQENRHSVALTRQTRPLPDPLLRAVGSTGGSITYVNRQVGGILEWARKLQDAIAEADLVVLHVHNQDIIPFIAMSGMSERPPVLLLNHADHVFWVGAGLVDGVISTRMSGHRLNERRRGVPPNRNFLLPLCLEMPIPGMSQQAAKASLGLPEDSIVLLTVARAVKFRSMGGLCFADAICPILQADSRVRLVVVGPGGTVDWSAAEVRAPGQILIEPEREDTRAFYAAADIYIDSFPFPSITSLLEAGMHQLPIVTRYEFGRGCEVMGADSIGIDATLLKAQNLGEMQKLLGELIADRGRRIALGRETMTQISKINIGPDWLGNLADIYDAALALPPRQRGYVQNKPSQPEDLDAFLPFVFGKTLARPSSAVRLAHSRELALKTMPGSQRLLTWTRMALRREFAFRRGSSSLLSLVPEWLTVRLRVRGG